MLEHEKEVPRESEWKWEAKMQKPVAELARSQMSFVKLCLVTPATLGNDVHQ